jgi:hypothetical protein
MYFKYSDLTENFWYNMITNHYLQIHTQPEVLIMLNFTTMAFWDDTT